MGKGGRGHWTRNGCYLHGWQPREMPASLRPKHMLSCVGLTILPGGRCCYYHVRFANEKPVQRSEAIRLGATSLGLRSQSTARQSDNPEFQSAST